ncbi:putative Nucleomorph-targeted precursor protein [Guillardia theta CCMP2712]|uniref:Histone H2A n=1 Tax=Guillardia theta (strain CCMP2712) TaxID=905079 RepID=L1JZB9_GUITC|nr:putative Nucleomorph-targeted precursor protein [Guillardia theta CCMP2712]EKX53926.1 putative Nucleomorph-targeted precursor protein [Guillardia theta CCMP2712]|mmetsp:Transcript_7399/g.25309  ORF Transcript_7399/g.25309 Transcript_7399/m.25309 type:complete len:219 (-) Transcript_7399:63-719(-)|eukprot:XP_005840906.1 putative Nucleomorph-targeted precursor protein [Guillardia theta CCMP2712]
MRGLRIFLGTLLLLQLFVSSTSALRPVDLGKHAVPKSRKSRHGPRADLSLRLRGGQDAGEKKEATEKKEEGAKVKKPRDPNTKSKTRSTRAGLQFPVGRIHRFIKRRAQGVRIAGGAAVYLAAVLEYLTAEVLELAGNAARDNKKTRIIPRHIQLAIRNDEELNKLLGHVTIAAGGVLPNIHSALLPKDSGKGEKKDHGDKGDHGDKAEQAEKAEAAK